LDILFKDRFLIQTTKSLALRHIFGIALIFLCMCCSPLLASDWVEGNTTEFTITPPHEEHAPIQPQVDQDKAQGNGEGAVGVRDPGGPVVPGARPHLRPATALEANISRWGHKYQGQDAYPEHGLGPVAEQLLWQAPMSSPPRTRVVGPHFFSSWLHKTHANFSLTSKQSVVEVKGEWDDAGHTLRSFGIPYTKANKGKSLPPLLSQAKVVIVNCAGWIPDQLLEPINKFVKEGGSLITTDWALDGCLNRAFPGFVQWNGGYSANEVVDAVVVEQDPELFAGAVLYAHWKLDDKCQTIKVLKPNLVHVLVRSRQLTREDPDNLGILALTFQYGKGRVLHLVGHFDNNSDLAFNNALPDPAPGINISLRQALACNFLISALGQTQAPSEQFSPKESTK
jgi:hypothetical protein